MVKYIVQFDFWMLFLHIFCRRSGHFFVTIVFSITFRLCNDCNDAVYCNGIWCSWDVLIWYICRFQGWGFWVFQSISFCAIVVGITYTLVKEKLVSICVYNFKNYNIKLTNNSYQNAKWYYKILPMGFCTTMPFLVAS